MTTHTCEYMLDEIRAINTTQMSSAEIQARRFVELRCKWIDCLNRKTVDEKDILGLLDKPKQFSKGGIVDPRRDDDSIPAILSPGITYRVNRKCPLDHGMAAYGRETTLGEPGCICEVIDT